jgi:phage recombination protein Bet
MNHQQTRTTQPGNKQGELKNSPMQSMTPVSQNVQKIDKAEKNLEFIPFGSADKITLNAKLVMDMIAVPTKSGKRPSFQDAVKFMMMCQAKRLNPWEGDAYLIGFDSFDQNLQTTVGKFTLITAHQAFLKRAELHPEFDGMQSGVILQNEDNSEIIEREGDLVYPNDFKLIGGWAKVYCKGRTYPTYRRLSLAVMRGKGYGRWEIDPGGMIVKCAEADALRSSFPTMLGGLYLSDEMRLPIDVSSTIESSSLVGMLPQVEDKPASNPAEGQQGQQQGQQEPPPGAGEKQQEQGKDKDKEKKEVKKPAGPKLSPQTELENRLTQEGISFNSFQQWAVEEGTVRGADSIGTWAEVPSDDAERMLRAIGQIAIAIKSSNPEKQ